MSLSQTRILVFARAPVPGRCKTRLIATHGARGAARIHRLLTLKTLATASRSRFPIELWCEPSSAHGFFLRCLRQFGASLHTQPQGDLGRKMALALQRTLARGAGKVIIVGTDCPVLTADDLIAAASTLDRADVVLQPAEDGGYVLIGARQFSAGALSNIAWSSGSELAQTLRRLQRFGFRIELLAPKWDVDRARDVRRCKRNGLPWISGNLPS